MLGAIVLSLLFVLVIDCLRLTGRQGGRAKRRFTEKLDAGGDDRGDWSGGTCFHGADYKGSGVSATLPLGEGGSMVMFRVFIILIVVIDGRLR